MALPDRPLSLLYSATHQATMATFPKWHWLGEPVDWTDNERLSDVGVTYRRVSHEPFSVWLTVAARLEIRYISR